MTFSPTNISKNSSARGTVPIEHLLNVDREPQSFRKANQSPQKVGQKIKTKRETKEFRARTWAPGRELWRRKSFCTLGNPLTGRVRGNFRISEGSAARHVLQGQKSENSLQRSHWMAFPSHPLDTHTQMSPYHLKCNVTNFFLKSYFLTSQFFLLMFLFLSRKRSCPQPPGLGKSIVWALSFSLW